VWAGDALEILVKEGYIDHEEYMSAVDGMVDAALEAVDEP
jgi:hypothetical protein